MNMKALPTHPPGLLGCQDPCGHRAAAAPAPSESASNLPRPGRNTAIGCRCCGLLAASLCCWTVSPTSGEEPGVQPPERQALAPVEQLIRLSGVRPVDLLENTPAKFRYWILGTDDLDKAIATGETRLQERIAQVEEVLTLSAEQRSRLELAGRGDLHRFLDECEEYLRSVDWAAVSEPGAEDEAVLEALLAESTRLQTRFCRGLHGAESLFHKTLTPWLTAEQQEAFQQRPQRFYGVTYGLRMR